MATDIYRATADDALSAEELALYHLIMAYRADLGLEAIPLSRGLTATAARHVRDTRENFWAEGKSPPPGANLHSWSDAPYYADHSQPQAMWEAPARLGTGYEGTGYEISAAGTPTVAAALEGWKASPGHNAVIANTGIWEDVRFAAIGIGVETAPGAGPYGGRIYHVWFGTERDPGGAPWVKGTSAADRIDGTAFGDRIQAGAGADLVRGGAGNDSLSGGSGNDRMSGGAGNDTLGGGSGDDRLYGLDGNDILNGGPGSDVLSGGPGNDRYLVDSPADRVVEKAGWGIDRIECAFSLVLPAHVENLRLTGAAAISGTGNGFGNTLTGNAGANLLRGGGGNDHLFGGAGNDRLGGGIGNDRLYGEAGNDRLYGGSGNDILTGGAGTDALNGGPGRDVFRFESIADSEAGAARDRIVDFIPGLDRLDLRGLAVEAEDLRYADGVLSVDADHDGGADLQIAFTNAAEPGAGDFLF